eukprot:CAMPEP_0201657746 /NCGR_PEP_ID=MMETSP0494-20130426/875_1 /ASSEMBLY_ACC=CAM_ASM_000839 /TAXON_ID=420259 /ORGANISM="Thalassiosira gravida, Strain GMp14c1" /LENGTH=993 /DNA_ID=CAMNT_0048134639 /DNA_START=149 /DNA_END=3130 /DNA_ORIENTATION=-
MSYNNNNNSSNNNGSSARKFTIKPFRSYTQMDSHSAHATFSSLASAMDEINNRNASTLSFEELYRNAYNLVLHKHGGLLYEGVQDRLGLHLRRSGGRLVRLAREDSAASGVVSASSGSASAMLSSSSGGGRMTVGGRDQYGLLEELTHCWKEHRITMVMVRDIFMYMDRTYVPQHRKRPVYDLGLWLFRRVVWERSMDDDGAAEDNEAVNVGGLGWGEEGSAATAAAGGGERSAARGPIKSNENAQTLGTVASALLLQVIQQDRLDRLEDAPQRTALLKDLIHMLLELAHANAGQFNDSSSGGRGGSSSGNNGNNSNNNNTHGNTGAADNIPVYERDFEEAFLGESQDFYRMESTSRLSHAASTLGSSDDATNSANLQNDDGASKPAAKYSAMEYVHRARSRLDEEKTRASLLDLPAQTKSALLRIVETELIERHAKTLVEMEGSGFASILKVVASSPAVGSVAAASAGNRRGAAASAGMSGSGDTNGVVIDRDRIADLASVYELFSRVPSSVNHLRDALGERVRLDGRSLVRDQETGVAPPAAFVKGVLDMRERFAAVVGDAMRGEKKAQKRMREAFEDFLNADARAANCLAVYVDELLRAGLRGADERRVARELDRVIVIFRYLADKDVFEAYYKNHLAKRLLGNKSGSEEAERAMVSLLKAECGYQFTSKLEGMFNDMRISKETAEKYRAHKKQMVNATADARDAENGGKPVDVEVSVLSNSHWPSQNVEPCILPTAVGAAMDRFQKYYLTTYTGRKLSWQTSTGSAEIRANLPPAKGSSKPRRHDLSVTTYQMCILVLFNVRDSLTLKQIREETHIPEDELRRHLVSLCTPKHRILRKGSKGKGISGDDDTFTYNADYTSKMTRVKVPMVSMRDATGSSSGSAAASGGNGGEGSAPAAASSRAGLVDGSSSVPITVEEDRRHLLEAAIVRIMKARKMLNHNDLVAEVTRQLSGRFVPPPQFVKKRVESLIEREYLERDEGDRRVYRYMA